MFRLRLAGRITNNKVATTSIPNIINMLQPAVDSEDPGKPGTIGSQGVLGGEGCTDEGFVGLQL